MSHADQKRLKFSRQTMKKPESHDGLQRSKNLIMDYEGAQAYIANN